MVEVHSYTDPKEGFRGWLVYDGTDAPLSAGGLRVQPGLTEETLTALARRMRLKQRLLGLNVDGAKCGIDYDPAAPGADDAVRRFLAFLRLELLERYSMGTDMGTEWGRLNFLARSIGIPSIKYAVARAQRMGDDEFFTRIALLTHAVGPLDVQQRRAGTGVAHAALAAVRHLDARQDEVTAAVHGFGNLGRGVVAALHEAGVRVVAVADHTGCLAERGGLDTAGLLGSGRRTLEAPAPVEAFAETDADVVVLAGTADALTPGQARELNTRTVVVGANQGLSDAAEKILLQRGIIVVPDFMAGAGSTASMDVIFGARRCPAPQEVLDRTAQVMTTLTRQTLERAAADSLTCREAALRLARETERPSGELPYGNSPYAVYGPDTRVPSRFTTRPADPAPAPSRAECRHERATVADSTFFGDLFSTPVSRESFCDLCRYQRWLDIEAALALGQAELGILDPADAETIAAGADLSRLDMALLRRELAYSEHSLVGLLRALQDRCGPAGQWVHHGATTQDIQDTSSALEMRNVLDRLREQVEDVLRVLARLARAHSRTPMLGRTHAQPALPITLGAKIATWIDELLRTHDRLTATRERVAVIELFGGAGTMAGYGENAGALIQVVARRLGLGVPDTAWHATRDRPAEFAATLALTAGAFGRIADELRTLSRPEIDEIAVPWRPGVVASSTMPHKRNADLAEHVVVLARLAAAQLTAALSGLTSDHERDARGYRLEWAYLPDVAHYTTAAAHHTLSLLRTLAPRPAVMWQRLTAYADRIGTEALMFELAPVLGKQAAHAWVYEHSQRAQEAHRPLREHLLAAPDADVPLTPGQLARALDPLRHLGRAPQLAEMLAQRAEEVTGAADHGPPSVTAPAAPAGSSL